MAVVIDANFIMATCAVFGVMCTIFGFFWTFVISPVIKEVSKAVKELSDNFKTKVDDIDGTLINHNKRITDAEKTIAVIETKITDHIALVKE